MYQKIGCMHKKIGEKEKMDKIKKKGGQLVLYFLRMIDRKPFTWPLKL